MRQNDDIALRPQWPSLLSVQWWAEHTCCAHHCTAIEQILNHCTTITQILHDCRRNKFCMITEKKTNFNTRWKHDNSSNKQLWPRWWRAPAWSTPQCALVMALVRFGNWRWLGWWCFFFFSAHSQVVFIQLVNRGIYSNQHIVKKLLRQRLWWWYIDSRRDLCK